MNSINRTIIVEADSRYLTQRVVETIAGYDEALNTLGSIEQARDEAKQARDDTVAVLGDALVDLENRRVEKWLLTADWQLRLDDGAVPPIVYPEEERQRRRSLLRDYIGRIEEGVNFAFFNGDLVDRPHLKTTGATNPYGFKEFREDIGTTDISLDRWFFMPGNHESDHVTGDIPTRATTEEYQRWIGATDYYTVKGNMAHVFVGDSAGYGASQEIMTQTLLWLDNALDSLRGLNIWLHFHAPIYGAHPKVSSDNSTHGISHGIARLQPILNKYSAHIVCATYGHVEHNPPGSVWDAVVGGIRWINITTFLQAAIGTEFNDLSQYHFNYVDIAQGASTARLRRMRLSDGLEDEAYRIDLTLPYAADLGGLEPSFDGRRQAQNSRPLFRGPVRSFVDSSWEENRVFAPGDPSYLPRYDEYFEAFQCFVSETGNDPSPATIKGGFGVYATVQSTDRDDENGFVIASTPIKRKAWFGGAQNSGTNDRGAAIIAASDNTGVMQTVASFTSGAGSYGPAGLNVIGNIGTVTGAVATGDGAGAGLTEVGQRGIIAYASGMVRIRRDDTPLFIHRDTVGGGAIARFHTQDAWVGAIVTTATATAYNTSSDMRKKRDPQDFDGLAIAEALRMYDFEWISDGSRAHGGFAQEMNLVFPAAVTEEDDVWSVDYSKFVPILIRAVQQLSQRLAALEGQAD